MLDRGDEHALGPTFYSLQKEYQQDNLSTLCTIHNSCLTVLDLLQDACVQTDMVRCHALEIVLVVEPAHLLPNIFSGPLYTI